MNPMWLTIVACALAALGFWLLWKWDTKASKPKLQPRMEDFARRAVAIAAKEFDVQLDYRVESLDRLEAILEQFHQRHATHPIPERDLSQIVLMWGAYLGIALQMRYGGHWAADSLLAGMNTYPLQWQDREAIPVMWCLRRIRKGSASNFLKTIHQAIEGREATDAGGVAIPKA